VRDLPPFSSRRLRAVPGAAEAPREFAAKIDGLRLANGRVSAVVDEATGGVTTLEAAGDSRNFVDTTRGEGLNAISSWWARTPPRRKRSGPATVTVVDRGPLVATLRVDSAAPGTRRLVRERGAQRGRGPQSTS